MSALPERRDPIDIEEFERRLRAPAAPSPRTDQDPLAELARLVGGQNGPDADPFAALFGDAHRPAAPAPQVSVPPPGLPMEFPDLRPLLRGGDFRSEPSVPDAAEPPHVAIEAPEEMHASSEYEDWAEETAVAPDAPMLDAPAARSRKPLFLAAAVIAAGFVGIGATLAWRGGAHPTQGVATIKAASSPIKIQPAASDTSDHAARDSTMLEKTPAPPVKQVVAHDEQPLDVSAAAKTPRIIPLSDDPSAPTSASSSSTSGAAAVAPAPPPPDRGQAGVSSAFPAPKRVKTVSVRADGSVISNGPAASEAAPAPKPPVRPSHNATPKTVARADATTPPVHAAKPKPKAKPAPKPHVAVATPRAEEPAEAPADEANSPANAAAEPAATTESSPRVAVSSGGYSVQLAAPGAEAEARRVAQRLGEKYSAALGGRRPSVLKASDKSVYRVRVSGLSRESANAMCGRIKSAGGACFVAR